MSPEVAWRYLEGGRAKHAFYGAPGTFTSARCGAGPRWWDPRGWLGTGSVRESEVLDALDPCKRCVYSLKRDQS